MSHFMFSFALIQVDVLIERVYPVLFLDSTDPVSGFPGFFSSFSLRFSPSFLTPTILGTPSNPPGHG